MRNNQSVKPDWDAMRNEYLDGNVSCRELAEKYGLKANTVSQKCSRENWNQKKPAVLTRVEKKVEAALEAKLMSKAQKWVGETVERMQNYRTKIDESAEQMHPAIDPLAIMHLVRSEAVVDEVARRSLGLRDQPQEVVVGTAELQSEMLVQLQALRKLKAEGKIVDFVPDVESMKRAKIVPDGS